MNAVLLLLMSILSVQGSNAEVEVRQALRNTIDCIRSWDISYVSIPRSEERPGEPHSQIHRRVAAMASGEYVLIHQKPHYGQAAEEDPFQFRTVFTPKDAFNVSPLSKSVVVYRSSAHEQLPGTGPGELLFVALGWWPFSERPDPLMFDRIPMSIRGILGSTPYRLRRQTETVNGYECHVLEAPGHDVLWLLIDAGRAAIVQREVHNPETGLLAQRISMSDFDTSQAVLIPRHIRNIVRDSWHTTNAIQVDAELAITHASLNCEVPMELLARPVGPEWMVAGTDGVLAISYKDRRGHWLELGPYVASHWSPTPESSSSFSMLRASEWRLLGATVLLCWIRFGRRLSPHTFKLAAGTQQSPTRTLS